MDILLQKIEKEKKEVLENLFFDTGSWILRKESDTEIQKIKELLIKNPKLKVEISGHTDDIGNDLANLELSKKRASTVVDKLIETGIEKGRIVAVGFGESQPKVKNDSDANRQLNRRIEIKFL
jgi:outer membrane protein OmpA-like peptidoglycan-associated protein